MEIGSSSDKIFKLYDQLELLEYQDKFVVKSLESPDQGFSISRREGNIETLSDASSSEKPSKTSAIYGVAGTIRLLAGTYLLVITSRKEVGSFLGFPVYRVESMKFLACNEALRFSNSQEKRDEAYFMTLLKTVEATPGLYYSYETDITLNLQRRCKLMEGWMSKPIWKQADPRFVWNKHLLEELIEYKLDEFIIPLLQGSFQMAQLELKNSPTTCTLLSRRCTRRLGTRMWRRGANLEGDTANFIETEQLLELEGFRCSLLQIRGSIPLLWEQIVDLSYKPRLRIINHEHTVYFFLKIQHFLFLSFSLNSGAYDLTLHFQLFIQPQVVERHFHDLFQRYGETIALDLTEKHGDEGQLSAAYSAEMQKLPNVRYVSFDFHHVCGNSNFDNLGVLYDQISEDFEKQGYFLIDTDGNILEEQKGIIRSNCIDCLDRTNVTQSYLARKSLNIQLQRLGVFTSTECIPLFAEDYGKFRTLWAEQGDEISLEYAGTHALKGDLVRYGKQTVAGLIKDGMSAVSRYYLNNFHDGIRQDALDLVSGRYTVSRNNPSPFQLNSFESFSYLPVASALLVGGLTLTTFTIQQAGRSAQHYVSSVFWAGVTAGVMALVKANGRQFCSRPRLCGLL
ncbi:phosphoinositide phosphatase SAC8 isoform X2 [Durio zibethinus]|uniref:Phosphoinositide phosphatase SAC8 isoform X2 n=1 Tax=Durio zibethinus TaxID=66656 RepID=A0A6P6AS80_DURZI|nr:phosphoinositide phosphatase SAC8 isoform X2 [Durio zibethinus]